MGQVKLNQVVISGYVPRDVFTNNNKTFAAFTVGIDKSYKNKDGNWVNNVAWISVKIWGKEDRIKRISENIKKGSYVVVTGNLEQMTYDNKDGQKVNDVFVKAVSIQKYGEYSESNTNKIPEENNEYYSKTENGQGYDFSDIDSISDVYG